MLQKKLHKEDSNLHTAPVNKVFSIILFQILECIFTKSLV